MTIVETLAATVGGFAALVALIWAMLGSPNLLSWFRNKRNSTPPAPHQAKRRVVNVEWAQLDAAATAFAAKTNVSYDLVVGIQPDGVVLANLLAGRLQTRYAAIDKQYPQFKRTPFFVFDSDKHSRSVRTSVTQFTPPPDITDPARVLIVDGVTTFGHGLLKAEEEVIKKFSSCHVDFYVFAIDQPRLAASSREITDRVAYHISIDNHAIWLHFPWDTE